MKMKGFDAIEYAEKHGMLLSKHADPEEEARESLSSEEAREIARDDDSLIYLEIEDEQAPDDVPPDQAEHWEPGCQTWPIYLDNGQRGQMTVWPNSRGAVSWGTDSVWGEWDGHRLQLDDEEIFVDEAGRECLPVVLVAAHDSQELEPIDELPHAATIEDAKEQARERGYSVIDVGNGGQCETTDAWDPGRGSVHVITVEP